MFARAVSDPCCAGQLHLRNDAFLQQGLPVGQDYMRYQGSSATAIALSSPPLLTHILEATAGRAQIGVHRRFYIHRAAKAGNKAEILIVAAAAPSFAAQDAGQYIISFRLRIKSMDAV